ncbi:MAG: hypothetical protein ACFB2Z_06110 [Maricaulaceae bacterium]
MFDIGSSPLRINRDAFSCAPARREKVVIPERQVKAALRRIQRRGTGKGFTGELRRTRRIAFRIDVGDAFLSGFP